MTYRAYNPAPVYLDTLGLKPCAHGSLTFCEFNTTTPKGTWADPNQTIPNENPVPLDSSGRSNTDIWLDGAYSITLRDGNGVVVWTRDVDSGQGSAATIPALVTGQFLTNDGSNLIWQDVRQVPDPSGSADYILGTDGSNLIWKAPPEAPPAAEVTSVDRVVIKTGGDTDWQIVKGTGTAPASGLNQTTLAVTFATPFKTGTTPYVGIMPTPGGQPGGPVVWNLTAPATATGFTVSFDVAEGNSGQQNIVNPVAFSWKAEGVVEAE
ncbi:MAG: hypothetical protein ACN6O2_01200 [Stenotrophomonas sp.]